MIKILSLYRLPFGLVDQKELTEFLFKNCEDVDKMKASGLTNGQLMKLAGNSIIVDVMSSFFKEMIKC